MYILKRSVQINPLYTFTPISDNDESPMATRLGLTEYDGRPEFGGANDDISLFLVIQYRSHSTV